MDGAVRSGERAAAEVLAGLHSGKAPSAKHEPSTRFTG
jgi:hypothetical protein